MTLLIEPISNNKFYFVLDNYCLIIFHDNSEHVPANIVSMYFHHILEVTLKFGWKHPSRNSMLMTLTENMRNILRFKDKDVPCKYNLLLNLITFREQSNKHIDFHFRYFVFHRQLRFITHLSFHSRRMSIRGPWARRLFEINKCLPLNIILRLISSTERHLFWDSSFFKGNWRVSNPVNKMIYSGFVMNSMASVSRCIIVLMNNYFLGQKFRKEIIFLLFLMLGTQISCVMCQLFFIWNIFHV